MTERAEETRADGPVPDLDDLLQCPVCYEIPAGHIFQCNEGHHVCGRCKLRLDVCPVCRAFFFGTRNYAMEELIANVKRLQAFKLGGKVTTGNTTPEQSIEVKESTSDENTSNNDDDDDISSGGSVDPPPPCSGLFRCLCCKTNTERLPSGRLLNHLRYFHSPELIEGRSENGEYIQAWQYVTEPGRIATAIRVADMGLFFLVTEITSDSVTTWLVMASAPRVAEDFSYTFTLSGNDREATFSDCVWSVRTCEGFLKNRQRCLSVTGADARAMLLLTAMSARLTIRRSPLDLTPSQAQPRVVLRVANRSAVVPAPAATPPDVSPDLEPFLQDLQNDVARLSRAFATLGREANALVRSEAEMRARLVNTHPRPNTLSVHLPPLSPAHQSPAAAVQPPPVVAVRPPTVAAVRPPTVAAVRPPTGAAVGPPPVAAVRPPPVAPPPVAAPRLVPAVLAEILEAAPLSRTARRRMRQRLRVAFRDAQANIDDNEVDLPSRANQLQAAPTTNRAPPTNVATRPAAAQNDQRVQNVQARAGSTHQAGLNTTNTTQANTSQGDRANNNQRSNSQRGNNNQPPLNDLSGFVMEAAAAAAAVAAAAAAHSPAPSPPPAAAGTNSANENNGRNKKKRRHRR